MRSFFREGDVVYPYGNSARAVVVDFAQNGKVVIEYEEDCIADFGWHRMFIYEKGFRLEVRGEHLYDRPEERP